MVDNAFYSIIDTGSSAINFSSLYFQDFIEKIFDYMGESQFSFQQGVITSPCYDTFPDLFFMFSKKWIRVDPEDYVLDVSDA